MTKNSRSRSKPVSTKSRPRVVPARKPASTRAYTACRPLQSVKSVIEFLGLSYSQVGAEYGRLLGGRAITRQAIYKMISGKRISDDLAEVLGQLVSNRLTKICGETIGVTVIQNSPLKITPYRYCDACGHLYAIDRPNVKRCPRCRK
jgi:hypothetical protein